MFGVKLEDVKNICETIVNKKVEAASKGLIETVIQIKSEIQAEVGEIAKLTEELKNNVSSDLGTLGQAIQSVSKATTTQINELKSSITAGADQKILAEAKDLIKMTERKASDSINHANSLGAKYEMHVQHMMKLTDTVSKLVSSTEAGETARAKLAELSVTAINNSNTATAAMMKTAVDAINQMVAMQADSLIMQKQMMSAVKEIATTLTAAIVMDEQEEAEGPITTPAEIPNIEVIPAVEPKPKAKSKAKKAKAKGK